MSQGSERKDNFESYTFPIILFKLALLAPCIFQIGCAYAKKRSGEIRVICNFAPGAPFQLETKYYCGILKLKEMRNFLPEGRITDLSYLEKLGFNMQLVNMTDRDNDNRTAINVSYPECKRGKKWGILALRRQYRTSWIRRKLNIMNNASIGAVARLVTR